MRVIVAILVLYGQAFAPWLCCCATAKVLSAVITLNFEKPEAQTIDKLESAPACRECCQKKLLPSSNPSPTDPVNQLPCPIQVRLIESQQAPLFERSDFSFEKELPNSIALFFFETTDLERLTINVREYCLAGPTLLMSVLRLKHHHCLLC